jgi:hypothetical protein
VVSKWDIPGREERMSEISRELGRLFTEQAELFRKGRCHTAEELRDYEASCERVRGLFAELKRLRKAG